MRSIHRVKVEKNKHARGRGREIEGRGGVSAALRGEFLCGLIFAVAKGRRTPRQTQDRTNNERDARDKWGVCGSIPGLTRITRHLRENFHRLLTKKGRERKRARRNETPRHSIAFPRDVSIQDWVGSRRVRRLTENLPEITFQRVKCACGRNIRATEMLYAIPQARNFADMTLILSRVLCFHRRKASWGKNDCRGLNDVSASPTQCNLFHYALNWLIYRKSLLLASFSCTGCNISTFVTFSLYTFVYYF